MSTTTVTVSAKPVRIIAIILMVAGGLLILGGGTTWLTVRDQLVAENITIPDDAMAFQGNLVDGPLDAYVQADIINKHALEGSGGQSYAEMDREDPARATLASASFLRASLFTSVIAFGVAAFAAGMGALFILVGWALQRLTKVTQVSTVTPVAARA